MPLLKLLCEVKNRIKFNNNIDLIYKKPNNIYVEFNNKKIGQMNLSTINISSKEYKTIENIAIDPPFRNKGIATAMYKMLIDIIKEEKLNGLASNLKNRLNQIEIKKIWNNFDSTTITYKGDKYQIININ